ncbi:hypothetical protein TNIN_235241 [Trichonephila inaurata madagascariensis]|uniref:Uncharacterized protein n=1 Tax=Trichonephila inaurata madagascariensis TaxID=2747483 RepID=A0A8X6YU68_9ARAC|nr:hypothetical protein TNIN_235241 [Trichonephila inaurata madagascariensis]
MSRWTSRTLQAEKKTRSAFWGATARVLVHAESWQQHPAAAARRWVFVTFLPPRHYVHSPPESKVSLCTPVTGRVSGHVEIWQRQHTDRSRRWAFATISDELHLYLIARIFDG